MNFSKNNLMYIIQLLLVIVISLTFRNDVKMSGGSHYESINYDLNYGEYNRNTNVFIKDYINQNNNRSIIGLYRYILDVNYCNYESMQAIASLFSQGKNPRQENYYPYCVDTVAVILSLMFPNIINVNVQDQPDVEITDIIFEHVKSTYDNLLKPISELKNELDSLVEIDHKGGTIDNFINSLEVNSSNWDDFKSNYKWWQEATEVTFDTKRYGSIPVELIPILQKVHLYIQKQFEDLKKSIESKLIIQEPVESYKPMETNTPQGLQETQKNQESPVRYGNIFNPYSSTPLNAYNHGVPNSNYAPIPSANNISDLYNADTILEAILAISGITTRQ